MASAEVRFKYLPELNGILDGLDLNGILDGSELNEDGSRELDSSHDDSTTITCFATSESSSDLDSKVSLVSKAVLATSVNALLAKLSAS